MISYRKREKLTPRIDVEKETEDHDGIIIIDSPPTSSKFVTYSTRPSSIKLKLKNEILKNNTYNQFWK